MKKITIISTVAGAALLIGLVAWLFISGRLVWASGTGSNVGSSAVVCDAGVVERYNEASALIFRDSETTRTADAQAIQSIKKDIIAKDSAKNDPTCQAILFLIAYSNSDYEAAKSAYDTVQSLYDKRMFADSNISGNRPLYMYEEIVESLSPDAQNKNKVLGG
jgi:hypothetical protein